MGERRPEATESPSGEIVLQAPPEIEDDESSGGVLTSAIPMLGSLGSVALMTTMGSQTSQGQERSLLAAGMFIVATVAFVLAQLDRQRTRRLRRANGARTAYLRHLGYVRTIAREAAGQQRAAMMWRHPDPASLPSLAEERTRVWEHTATDSEFLQVRYGVCSQPLSLDLVAPDSAAAERVDPAAAAALHRLLAVHRVQQNLPATVDLRAYDRIEICGGAEEARALARAMICSAAAFQSPRHLAIAVLASEQALAEWDWVKWLPHAHSGHSSDAVGPRRMVSTDLAELASLLPPEPHLLLVVDGGMLPPGRVLPLDGRYAVTVLELPDRWDELDDDTRLRLLLDDRAAPAHGGRPMRVLGPHEPLVGASADQCDLATAEALARRLAPLHVTAGAAVEPAELEGITDFMGLLGLPEVRRYGPATGWRSRPARDRLRVPIGLADSGEPIHLDLKEAAQQGMGPHGLVIGATGSGKSELLRTLVLGLALTHSPDDLNMVLVDFKGGATFSGMSGMPHVSAVITNLADELTLVDRMQDALSGEMVRRQEVLRAAGSYASVRDYERARAAGAEHDPLPSLFIVVDEFSELLTARPELIDLFVAIGRLGRSLGLHLLLASQRLDEGRLRGLESHLSYRVGLRMFSAQESRTVLGVPDAYGLPPTPGLGFLRTDQSTLLRFTAAYVSGSAVGRGAVVHEKSDVPQGILPWTITEVRLPERPEPTAEPQPEQDAVRQESLLTAAVRRMVGLRPAARRVWLPPLDVPDTLDALLPDLAPDPVLGLVSQQWRALGGLTVPVGTVDRPREQRRDTLTVDLSGAGGHVAVVGGPRSGKSTLLRTLVTSLALTTTPAESQFFVLDSGGGTFSALQALPHVAGIGTRSEPDVVRRIVAEVRGVVDRREAYFRAGGIDSIETYRSRRRQGLADDGYGEVFLVVDGWSTLRSELDDLEVELQQLAARGLTFGFHLLAASSRWADFRAAARDLFGTRLELRIGDPTDSEIDRTLATRVPPDRPGRGLVPGKLHFLAALPRIDGEPDVGSLADGVEQLVSRVGGAWHGPTGPKLRLLPARLTMADLLGRATERVLAGPRLLIGLNESDLAPVVLDPDCEPHWLIFGDGRSGKSAALRAYVDEVVRTRTSQQAQLVVVDYRRSLLGEVPEDHLLAYLTSAAEAVPTLAELASCLERRLPGHDVTPQQLRDRSWWTGAEVFVVVDDYDLVTTPQSSPVQVLQPLLAQARDVGLHLVVARRAGGASRALYEPVIQALRELGSPGLVLSGSPDEGALIGQVRPLAAPAGRGRLVTRDRGVEVVQIAWRDPSL
jgi:S-DNA-T family DNA segregation ATPase FtsK/SpoIIIE